ncbi:MAG TPA: hypothetical protein VFG23_26410 [Polyangia bacterium]|nr:hypothetical protein [Polyangia bacterium]
MSVSFRRALVGAFATALFAAAPFAAAPANANPRPLPYTYIYETLPKGDAEIELYSDLEPLRVNESGLSAGNGAQTWYLASQFQLEIEYGLTDRLELGLYLTLAPTDPALQNLPRMSEGTGVKQRLRYRFADAGQWPIDLAVYGEATENQSEIEIEGKIILQRRVGAFRIAANAWAEREYYFSGAHEWVLNPAAGVVFEKWITAQPGIEYWMHAEYSGTNLQLGPDHFLGPTVILQLGKIWWSTGVYAHLNGLNTLAPSLAVTGDPFGGPIWVRTIVGISY